MAEQIKLHLLSDKPIYNAKAVTAQTGITPTTLRAWERRYGVLLPDRTSGGHRLYSERDIAALKWLKQQLEQGLTIGRASEILKGMLSAGATALDVNTSSATASTATRSVTAIVAELHQALIDYDEAQAESILSEAYALYPIETVCLNMILPVFQQLGSDWEAGRIQVATEHFATNYLRRKLIALVDIGTTTRAGTIVTGCAPDDLHEGGVLMLSIFLRRRGWKVVYLGQMVPFSDLPNALKHMQAQVLVLSATLIDTARELAHVADHLKQIDAAQRPTFAFGGAAFNQQPELREKVEGVFLGETIQAGIDTIEKLMTERKK
jgi:methanogenic corrinoid protein MtbC1